MTPEKYLIVDVPRLSECVLGVFTTWGIHLLDPEVLTARVCAWDLWSTLDPARTFLVLPGNGAHLLAQYLTPAWIAQWQWVIPIYAKRYWEPGSDPIAVADRIYPRGMILSMRDVVVIDDVISSGVTCRTIQRINSPWIPAAAWHAAVLVKQRSAMLRGFASSFGACEVGTKEKKVPINSLSTLLQDRTLAESYALRNVEDADGFLRLLEEFRA